VKFGYSWFLYLIPLAVLLCHVLFLFVDKFRNRRLKAFLGEAYPRYMERHGKPPVWVPQRYFLALCVVFLMFACARPYFQPEDQEDELRMRVGADFMVAIDASKSMLARDTQTTEAWREAWQDRETKVKGKGFIGSSSTERKRMRRARNMADYDDPDTMSRLQAAKQSVRDLIEEAKGDRIGLIAFTNEAGLRAPLTYDFTALALVLESVSPGTVPPGGTSLESAITRAHGVFKGKEIDKPVLVILSDGEQHEGNAYEAAMKFRQELGGVIHTVGIGSPAGAKIRVSSKGRNPFIKDGFGQEVTTRLDKLSLNRIAQATGGRYVDLGENSAGLLGLYREQIKPYGDVSPDEFPPDAIELFQIPLMLAFLSLVCDMLVRAKARPLQTQSILQS